MSDVLKILEFMSTVEKLCLVNRDNLLSKGGFESDSDHIMKLMFLIMAVYPYLKTKADYTRMLELALVHDLAESIAGDVPLIDSFHNPDLKEQKRQAEQKAMEEIKAKLPPQLGEKVYSLFMEYEERKTIESRLVKALDVIDANLQANLYNDGDVRYWKEYGDGDWYYCYALSKKEVISNLGEEILFELEEALIKLSKDNMQKHNIFLKD